MLESNDFAALLGFLDKIREKGEINPTTGQARKTACDAIIKMIDKEEPHTVEWLSDHVDDLIRRLINKYPNRLTQRSVQTYKSRVIGAISDFLEFQKDPVRWRPKPSRTLHGEGKKSTEKKSAANRNGAENEHLRSHAAEDGRSSTFMNYQFPLRTGHTVEIRNIPRDLKIEEVWRLACFVATLAQDFRPTGGSPFGEMVVTKG